MKITTKKGDTGRTSLLDKRKRVSKTDVRKEINGTLDEVNSVLGLARATCDIERINRLILRVQEEIFMIGSEVAASPDNIEKVERRVEARHVRRLEKGMDSIEKRMPMPENFVVAGATQVSAMLDMARTFTRRAERKAVEGREGEKIRSPQLMKYLNRLSDYLFTLARYYEFLKMGKAEWPAPRKW
ncbi:cob(I)yrinic acid a,c-diamide adenosyltransferase [Candidatus Poribacteria bacterium]|nr:cob(I)yrinic acid a,c-diamide adenosyltransferase [Candidatus Poribacteria bacterium]